MTVLVRMLEDTCVSAGSWTVLSNLFTDWLHYSLNNFFSTYHTLSLLSSAQNTITGSFILHLLKIEPFYLSHSSKAKLIKAFSKQYTFSLNKWYAGMSVNFFCYLLSFLETVDFWHLLSVTYLFLHSCLIH